MSATNALALPMAELSIKPLRRTRQLGRASAVNIEKVRAKFRMLRFSLVYELEHMIKAQLLDGEPIREEYAWCSGELGWEALDDLKIQEIASLVPNEKAERILRKWLGKTEHDRLVALEAIRQMYSHHVVKDAEMPRSLYRFLDCNFDTILAEFSVDDAKDLCTAWAPIPPSSRLRIELNELTRAAKRMCDAFGDSLKGGHGSLLQADL